MRPPLRPERRAIVLFALIGLCCEAPARAIAADAGSTGSDEPDVPRRYLHGDPLPAGAVLRLGTTRYRQDSPIYRIAYSLDGKYYPGKQDPHILE
jgi:hypothetical protein